MTGSTDVCDSSVVGTDTSGMSMDISDSELVDLKIDTVADLNSRIKSLETEYDNLLQTLQRPKDNF